MPRGDPTRVVSVRLTGAVYDHLRRAANGKGLTVAAYLARLALQDLKGSAPPRREPPRPAG